MKNILNKIVGVIANFALLVGTLAPLAIPAPAYATTVWNVGDVYAAIGGGSYNVYDNAGVFKETINDGLGGTFTTGCAFNNTLDKLYTTNFSNTKVAIYNDAIAHTPVTVVDTGLQNAGGQSESVVFAANGDYYVGHPDGNDDILRYNSANVFQQAYNVPIENRGSDWLDLAANQTTMFYTSEGRKILRYDVGADAALADFGPGLPGVGTAFALRLLPPGDGSGGLLVADNSNVKQLDGLGNVISTYDVTGVDGWFALNLDPNGTHFWAGSFNNGTFYKFLIEPVAGNYVDTQVTTVATGSNAFFGLCLKGELTAAQAQITLDPPTDTNAAGTSHTVTATVTQGGNPVVGTLVSFSVTAGPNAGQVSDPGECSTDPNCNTDANGQTSWTYTSNGAVGVDVIEACFTDASGQKKCAEATKEWVEPPSLPGRMTGGGTIADATLDARHGFELHCDEADLPNRLEVNWGKGNKFHLETLTSALCSNDPTLDEEQPVAGFDTYKGKGAGRLNGVSGATAEWKFTDDGEPGVNDYATITITDGVNTYTFSGNLGNGNHQAHPDN